MEGQDHDDGDIFQNLHRAMGGIISDGSFGNWIRDMINEFLDSIQQRISGVFNGVVDFFYIAEWGTIVFAVVATCVLLALFFTHPVIRACLGFIAWGAVTLFVGMVMMFRHDREKKKVEPTPRPQVAKSRDDHWFPFS